MLKLVKTSLLTVAVMATSVVASDILVTVNGKNITKQDAEQFVAAAQQGAHFAQLDKAQQEMIKQRLVEKILFTELAKKEGVENDPEFKAAIEKIKEELLVNVWMKKQLDSTLVSDSEAKEFYEKNKDKFKQPETVTASHILVKTEDEAKAIIEELKPLKGAALKEKFVVLAKAKSTGPSGPKGGDLGTFTQGQMVPEFAKAVWALKDGTVTLEAVKTQFGYHVIYLEKKNPAIALPYDAVKEKIIQSLKQKQFAVKVAEVAKELKSKAKIVDTSKEAAPAK
ncbi:MAG TPA: peptidylprolyl isomerase [Sulfurovum sp.]|nr:peptidylprolyl isomerase [Sulfurovum sp.]